jgi:undecaprenyl-diphosphatase
LNPWHAVLLAVVQGITEFIPVSSSAHLILVPFFLGWKDQGLDFDIATNTGTLIAVLVYFRRDVRDLVVGFFTNQPRSEDGDGHPDYHPRRLAWAITLGTIPAGIAGLLLHDWVKTQARNPLLIAGTSIGYGLLLLLADRLGKKSRALGDLGISAALVIGLAQALALIPGTSRAGITITAALLLGFSRPAAARFSFLLSIPIGVLVALKSAKDLMAALVTAADLVPMAIGIVVSAVVGYLVIAWLLAWLRRQSLTVFVVYRLLLGALILATYFMLPGY